MKPIRNWSSTVPSPASRSSGEQPFSVMYSGGSALAVAAPSRPSSSVSPAGITGQPNAVTG